MQSSRREPRIGAEVAVWSSMSAQVEGIEASRSAGRRIGRPLGRGATRPRRPRRFSAMTVSMPQEFRCSRKISRLPGSPVDDESAQSGQSQPRLAASTSGLAARPRARGRTSNQKVEPRSTGCRTPISPPISVTSWRQMASPRPGAAVFARGEGVGLAEGVENVRLGFRRDADAGVDHLEAQQIPASSSARTRTITSPATR